MTVVVAFHCVDGVVIAADSMITPSMGGISVGHHHGLKIGILNGPQLFAFAGDQGQSERFKHLAHHNHQLIQNVHHPLDYVLQLSTAIVQQLQNTGIGLQSIGINTILAFEKDGEARCCVFEGPMQPRFLDANHFYVALGSGKLSADPFLRFLVDIFCAGGAQPTVSQALFLATWAVQHVIETNPGGVAAPIRLCVLEKQTGAPFSARMLPDDEIAEHQQAIESAMNALRSWRDQIQSGEAADDAPPVPAPPTH